MFVFFIEKNNAKTNSLSRNFLCAIIIFLHVLNFLEFFKILLKFCFINFFLSVFLSFTTLTFLNELKVLKLHLITVVTTLKITFRSLFTRFAKHFSPNKVYFLIRLRNRGDQRSVYFKTSQ